VAQVRKPHRGRIAVQRFDLHRCRGGHVMCLPAAVRHPCVGTWWADTTRVPSEFTVGQKPRPMSEMLLDYRSRIC
jgi:hypothetical protein